MAQRHGGGTRENLWTLPETAQFLGVPEGTLYQWASRGTGPRSFRVGRYRRYDPADVRAWLEKHASMPAGGAA